jgi:hypothetical protein
MTNSIHRASFVGDVALNFPVVVITGICRSGKTLLGNLLATCPEVEYADEPHTAMMLPMAVETNKIEVAFAESWFRANLKELFNDLIMLRSANFRPDDLSSIWSKKTQEEISDRLININTRTQAKQLSKTNNSSLVVTLSECLPFIDFINRSLKKCKFIHVIRNGFDVAAAVTEKKWFSDEQLLHPINAQLYVHFQHGSQTWHLPWWVDMHDYEFFLQLDIYSRGVYYWCSLMEKGLTAFQNSEGEKMIVAYADLVARPVPEFEKVCNFLNFKNGLLTKSQLAAIQPQPAAVNKHFIDTNLQKRMALVTEMLNSFYQRKLV